MSAQPSRTEITDAHLAGLSGADMSGYWWYAVRQAHLDQALATRPDPRAMRYLDFGCGTGGVLSAVLARWQPQVALGLDGTQAAVDLAVARGLPARYADFRAPLALPFRPDVVSCMDVLEHLEDPVLALRHLREVTAPDALLVVTVPAMPSLHSRWDDVCGHHRRYTKALVAEHLRAGGWRAHRLRHVFSYCVPPAWLQRRVFKRVQEMEFPPVSPLTNRLMTAAGRFERALGSPFPFGTSIVATATRG